MYNCNMTEAASLVGYLYCLMVYPRIAITAKEFRHWYLLRWPTGLKSPVGQDDHRSIAVNVSKVGD